MNTEVKNRLQGLKVLKALCAFGVITIHAPFPGTMVPNSLQRTARFG